MQRTTSASLLATASTFLCLHTPAQTFQPVPAYADVVDGHGSLSLPFGSPGFRTQILVDATQIAPSGALLNGISLRADRTVPGTGPTQVPNVTIQLSQTSVTIGSLATTFATNITGPTTVVFQGTVSLPAPQTGSAGPLPWNIVIPFAQPFALVTAQGNLLIDIVGNNPGGGNPTFFLDAVRAGGSVTQFGDSGPGVFHFLTVMTANTLDPRLVSPGHPLSFTVSMFQNPPGVLALGTGAQPVPVDLGPLGAPMNFLYVDPIVLAPHIWFPTIQGFASTMQVAVPNNATLIGATLYGQSAALLPFANPLGLVLSHAVEVRIGDEFEVLGLQQVNADDPAAATGALADFGAAQPEYGGVPIRFEGAFF